MPPCKKIGDLKVNLVAIVPLLETLTCDGSRVTSAIGTIVVVGYPASIVLIWHVTGIARSFDWKNTSIDVTKQSSSLGISTDSARGSIHSMTRLFSFLVLVATPCSTPFTILDSDRFNV